MAPPLIVDTNVLVSALGRREGYPARIIASILAGGSVTVISPALTAEYESVVPRRRLTRLHGLAADALRSLLDEFYAASRHVSTTPGSGPPCPDPGDQHLWDLLAAEPEAILVTGDALLLASGGFPGRILTPREFVERYLP